MALAFGGGVRPELGRTDYGAVARGSEIAAQLSAQGSQMVGKGIASLGASLGNAIKEYEENKVLTNTQIGSIEAAVQSGVVNPEEFTGEPAKLFGTLQKNGTLKLKDAALLNAYVNQVMVKKQDALKRSLMESQIASAEASSRLASGQANALEAQQKDQSALAQALLDNSPIPGEPVDYDSVRQSFLERGGQNVEMVNALFPKTKVTPNITAVPNPVTGENVPVLQTGATSFTQIPGLPVKSATETRIEAEAVEEKRILDIQRTAIALDGDEQKKYLDSLSLTDRGAAKKAIRAYEGRGEKTGLLEQILNPAGTSAPTGGSNNKEFRSNF
jgi:hypothetical protein